MDVHFTFQKLLSLKNDRIVIPLFKVMTSPMRDHKIVIYNHPNPEIKSFLVDEEISAFRVERFKKPLDKNSENSLQLLGVIGSQIVKEILAIQAVMKVEIKPKEIIIKKELSSSWREIEDRVLEILKRALRKKKIKIVSRSLKSPS